MSADKENCSSAGNFDRGEHVLVETHSNFDGIGDAAEPHSNFDGAFAMR